MTVLANIPEVYKWLVLLVILLLFYLLWLLMAEQWGETQTKAFGGSGSGQGEGQGQNGEQKGQEPTGPQPSDQFPSPQEPFKPDQRDSQLVRKVRRILEQDPDLANDLTRMAGTANLPADQILSDQELLHRIASRVPEEILDMLEVASRKVPIGLDLESGHRLVDVKTGGIMSEPTRMKDLSEIRRMKPIEYGLPKTVRRHRMVTGQARASKRLDLVQVKKLLYVLEDASGSMIENHMQDGNQRFIWSRGVIIKLARLAVRGKTRFYYRQFDSQPKTRYRVTNAQEAREFLDSVAVIHPSGGGTFILGALAQAVSDIRSEPDITEADILLVSDGEDGSIRDPQQIKDLLGSIRLNVIVIGSSNVFLKKVATTYQEIH